MSSLSRTERFGLLLVARSPFLKTILPWLLVIRGGGLVTSLQRREMSYCLDMSDVASNVNIPSNKSFLPDNPDVILHWRSDSRNKDVLSAGSTRSRECLNDRQSDANPKEEFRSKVREDHGKRV